MLITVIRYNFAPLWTDGLVLVDGTWFGYALEDRKLHEGKENVVNTCCVLPGEYKVIVTQSGTFGRRMPLILDTPGRRGCRIHGGNTERDIKGCQIYASRKLKAGHVQGSLEATITHRIDLAGGQATLRIMEAA